MSLILDALNRSRLDSDAVPGLATQHYVEVENDGGSKSRQILLWLALGAALVVIIALLFERDPQPVPVEASLPAPAATAGAGAAVVAASATQASSAASLAVDPKPAPEKPIPETAAEPPAQVQAALSAVTTTADDAVATVPEKTAVQRLYEQREQQANAIPEEARSAAGKSALADNTAALAESANNAPAEKVLAQRKQEPIDIEKVVLQAREELKDERLDEHPAPFIAELSQQAKNDIPTIYYQRHDYSGDSARSSVMLNSKSVKVGGNVAPGVKLDEILPDSVVLDYRGTQFRLRALNSWINL